MEPMVLTYQLGEEAVAVLRRVHNQLIVDSFFLFDFFVIFPYIGHIQYDMVLLVNFYTG